MAEVGFRVIRGPDWPLHDEDGGEGCVGTVVEVGGKGRSTLPSNLVIVQWDMGNRHDHRAGYYNDYDLYVIDSAPAGVRHEGLKCSGCLEMPIYGMRWHCLDCSNDINLCTICYMNDEHEKNHHFERIDQAGVSGVKVNKRIGADKLQIRGIFSGANVTRGPDWRWGDQDGGETSDGFVLEVDDWKEELPRSAVKVSWTLANKGFYRVGYKGRVDLRCVTSGIFGFIYKSHLPVLGWEPSSKKNQTDEEKEKPRKQTRQNPPEDRGEKNGDFVAFKRDKIRNMKQRNENKTSKAPSKKVGDTPQLEKTKTFRSRKPLAKEEEQPVDQPAKKQLDSDNGRSLRVGDTVTIVENVENLRKLQVGHGHCQVELMTKCAGRLGKVLSIDEDGDVEVMVETLEGSKTMAKKVVFNPEAIQFKGASRRNTSCTDNCLETLKADNNSSSLPQAPRLGEKHAVKENTVTDELKRTFVAAAGQGHLPMVKRFLELHPDMLDCLANGQTALHQACHNGQMEVVDFLLKQGASLAMRDHQEFTALHHSCYGDTTGNTAGLVIFSGANINDNRNPSLTTPLHLAVIEANLNAVFVVMQGGCDTNLQDAKGNTAMHLAIMKGLPDIMDALLASTELDLCIRDIVGCNPVVRALCKRFFPITIKMIDHCPRVIQEIDKYKMTVLHYAAVYDDVELVECILRHENCDLEIRNINGETPLDLALAAGNSVAENLLRYSTNQGAELLTFKRETSSARENHVYVEGETVRVREPWTVVAALQHCHGGWNSLMKTTVGKLATVINIDSDGDVAVRLDHNGLPLVFNPLALSSPTNDGASPFPVGDHERTDEPQVEIKREERPPLRGFSPGDIAQSLCNTDLGKALFLSVSMQMVWRVKEILGIDPEMANHSEASVPVLHQACRDGGIEVIEALLDAGANMSTKPCGSTVLHESAIYDETGKTISLLLQKGRFGNPDVKNNVNERIPLHLAVIRGNWHAVNALVENGSDVKLQDSQGNTVFHFATANEREDIIEVLLDCEDLNLSSLFNVCGMNPIHIACRIGNVKVVKQLLQREPQLVNLLSKEQVSRSPLHIACLLGHLQSVNELLQSESCDLKAKDGRGDTALVMALKQGWELVVRRLIYEYEKREPHDELDVAFEETVTPRFDKGNVVRVSASEEVLRALHQGESTFDDDLLETLGKKGQVLSVDANGKVEVLLESKQLTFHRCALTLVSKNEEEVKENLAVNTKETERKEDKVLDIDRLLGDYQKHDFTKKLVEVVAMNDVPRMKCILRADPQRVMSELFDGNTALHLACQNRSVDVVRFLLENGANPVALNSSGLTPLHIAAAYSAPINELSGNNVVSLLLENGADPNTAIANTSRMTSLHSSIIRGREGAARVLIHSGADINARDDRGDTPLNYAIKLRNDKIVDVILACPEYDPLLANEEGCTALHLAAECGNSFATKKLCECYGGNSVFVDTRNNARATALFIAAENNKLEVLRILVEVGKSDVSKENNANQTPLDVALLNGYREVEEILCEYGASRKEGNPRQGSDNRDENPGIMDKLARGSVENGFLESQTEQEDSTNESAESATVANEATESQLEEVNVENETLESKPGEGDVSNKTLKLEVDFQTKSDSIASDDDVDDVSHASRTKDSVSDPSSVEGPSGCVADDRLDSRNSENQTKPDKPPMRQSSREVCSICWDRRSNIRFEPCKHIITCSECGINVATCPICRGKIHERIMVRSDH